MLAQFLQVVKATLLKAVHAQDYDGTIVTARCAEMQPCCQNYRQLIILLDILLVGRFVMSNKCTIPATPACQRYLGIGHPVS